MSLFDLLQSLDLSITDVKIGDNWYSRGMGTRDWYDEEGVLVNGVQASFTE